MAGATMTGATMTGVTMTGATAPRCRRAPDRGERNRGEARQGRPASRMYPSPPDILPAAHPVRGRCSRAHRRRALPVPGFGETRALPVRTRRQGGFTLVELAVVVAILGLVLGTFLAPLRAQMDAARTREAERALGEIREALVGYAMTRGALPCPDVVSDGVDGVAPATCSGAALAGVVPYQTLGVPRADPWGRLYAYRVTQEFSNRLLTGQPPAGGRLDLTDTGDITVLTRGDDPATGGTAELKHQSAATALTRTAPALVLSFGPNGLGGIGAVTGQALAPPPGSAADETENADADATFVSRIHSRGADNCDDADESSVPLRPSCEFDDVVAWISTPVLMARLVDARVLP